MSSDLCPNSERPTEVNAQGHRDEESRARTTSLPGDHSLEVADAGVTEPSIVQAGQSIDSQDKGKDVPHQMTQAEKQTRLDVLSQVYAILFRAARERDWREFNWTERPVLWVKDESQLLWTCGLPPNRATVTPTKDRWFWQAWIERHVPARSEYNQFVELTDAVIWAEEQLTVTAAEDDHTEGELERTPAPRLSRIDLDPYRIDASLLEPERITYRVIMEVDAAPERFKTVDLLDGGQLQHDERHLSPNQLATELEIDQSQCTLEQPLGPNHGWNLGRSTVTYYRESVALDQAQRMWNSSRIVEYYRRGKLLRARYGIEEAETGYVSWLGGCDNPEGPWPKDLTRAEYLAQKAEELTLVNALDVDGFRAFTDLSHDIVSDERLLFALHRRRSESSVIPAAARAESRHWLAERGL